MTNILLLIGITFFFLYVFYDQFGMNYLKGKTILKIALKKKTKIDAIIFISLIIIILYQVKFEVPAVTLYLLSIAILLSIYIAFIRYPQIIFKEKGFFFENIYISYQKIKQVNLTEDHKFVIELTNTKCLVFQLANDCDQDKIVNFFGGYKSP